MQELTIYGEGKGGGGHTPVEAADTLKSKQTMRLLFAVSEGEIDSVQDILVNSASISNFETSVVSYQVRTGTTDQTIITGFSEVEAPLEGAGNPTLEIKHATVYVKSILGQYDAIRVTFMIDRLVRITGEGDRVGHSVTLDVFKRRKDKGDNWVTCGTLTKKGKCTNPYAWDVRIEKPEATTSSDVWEIKVVRTSADDADDRHMSKTFVSNIITITEKALTYPKTALVGVTVYDAKTFGTTIPELKFKVKGIKLYLPDNYTVNTRTYNGQWSGNFKSSKEYTDNLAWVLYWTLRDNFWGLGISAADIDLGAFYNFARYCDELVPTGVGTSEPRYTVHLQCIERENVPTFLMKLLTLGNANFSSNDFGQVKIIWDGAGQAITKVVSNATVVDGMFEYTSNDLEGRTNLVNVTYAREDFFGDSDTVTHFDNSLITRYGLQTSDVILLGCKSEYQALRKARWTLYNNCYSGDMITFKQLFQGAHYQIGELVSVMDSDNVSSTSKHAIIKSFSISGNIVTLVLDREITLTATDYSVEFVEIDGITFRSKNITQTNGNFSTISYSGTETPYVGSTILFKSLTLIPRVIKVVKIDKDENNFYIITGITHHEDKYLYVDNTGTFVKPTGSYVNFDNFSVAPITNLQIEQVHVVDRAIEFSKLLVSWDWSSGSTTHDFKATFEVSYRRDSQEFIQIKDLNTSNFDIEYPLPGIYEVYVWAVNPFSGIKSIVTTNIEPYNYRSVGATSSLLPPLNVRVSHTNGVIFDQAFLNLTWDYNTSNDTKEDTLKDYVVQVLDIATRTVKGTFTVPANSDKNADFTFSFADNITAFGTAQRSFVVKIYSRDIIGDLSVATEVTPSNPVPLTQNFSIFSGVSSVYIRILTVPENDIKGYMVWRSTTANFSATSSNITTLNAVYDGLDTYITLNVPTADTYYYAIAAYDSFGKIGLNISGEQSSTGLSADATTWTKTGLQFTANATTKTLSWTAGTVIRNGATTYNVAAGSVVHPIPNSTSGFIYVYFDPSKSETALQTTATLLEAVAMGSYPLATYTGGDNSTIKGGDGNAFISGSQIIAGTVGASEIKAGSIVANLIDTQNAVITGTAQIADGIISNAKIGNSIMSLNYNPTTHKGWIIDKTGSILTYGSIGILDENGNVIFAGGNFDWRNVKGNGVPDLGATRNVFVGPWLTSTNYIVGDIVTDGLGYGWSCVTAHTSSAGVKTPVYPITSNSYWVLYTVKGDSASSTTIVPIYRRVAGTNPSLPLPSGVTTYNFNSGTLTGLDNGWTKDVPAGTDPLYMSAATAVGVGTDTILTSEWATPVLFVSNGVNGTPGTNTATVTLYQTTATSAAPVVPNIPLTYKFSDATIAETLPNNWQRSLPTTGAYRWVTTATALGTGTTDVIQASEWAPTSLLAQDGVNGLRTAILDMYQWAVSPPTLFPSGSSTFRWSTGQFTAPPTTNNWYLTPQTPVKGQTLYVARTIYTDSLTTETTPINWTATTSTARSVAGIDGTPGTRTAYLEVYKWSVAAPTTFPQGNSTYTWANGTFTDANINTNGWLLVPGTSVQGQTLWGISQTYTDTGSSLSSPVTWSSISPYPLGYSGVDGQPGKTASTFGIDNAAAIFNKNSSGTIAPSAGITLTTSYQNVTGSLGYQWQKNGSNITGATSSSYTVPTSDYSSVTTNTYKVTITGTINGVFGLLTDTITIPMLVDGGSGPVVLLSNENITFGAPNVLYSGIDFSNGTCDVTAYIGSTQLTYAASGANTFSLTYSSSSATVGAGSNPTSQILRIPAPTGMSAESATNTITITLRDASGIALPLVVKYLRYNLSRAGAVGMSYWLSNTDYLKRSTSLVYSPAAITLNGYSAAGSTTPAAYPCRFKIYEDGSAAASYTSSVDEASKSYTPSTTAVSYIKVEMYLAGGTTTLVDYSTIPVVQDGSQAITLVEPNSAVLLPADSAGNVSSYSGSGTTIKVFEGSNQLTFTTGVVTKGYFGVSAAVSTGTVTVGGISGAYTTTCTVGNHSGLSTDLANITYTISIIKADGTSVVLTDIQTLTKSKAGAKGDLAAIVVINGEQAFKYATPTSTVPLLPATGYITLTANLFGPITAYAWEYYYPATASWYSLGASSSSQTYNLYYNNANFTGNSIRVRCISAVNCYDEMTIVKLYDGANGKNSVIGYLTNESAALPADSSGTVSSYTGASGNFKMFDGTTDVTTLNCAYSVVAPNPASGVTISIGSTTGAYTASGTMNADAVSFTLNAVYSGVTPAVTVSKVLSLTRAKAGVAGVTTTVVADTVTVSGEQAFNYPAGATTPTSTSLTLTALLTGTLTSYTWQYWSGSWLPLPTPNTNSTYSLTHNTNSAFPTTANSIRIRCLSGTTAYDEMTIVRLYSGTNGKDSVVGYLTNETATFPADKDGVVSDYTVAAGQFKVFRGTTDITSGYSTTYSVTTAIVSGLTLTINTAGTYTVSESNASLAKAANSFTFEVKAVTSSTYGSVTVVKSIKYAKSKTGSTGVNGITAQLSSDSIAITCDSSGVPITGAFLTSVIVMTISNGGLDDSANWTYATTFSTNVTSSSLSTSRSQTINGFTGGTTTVTGFVEFTASKFGYSSIVKKCILSKIIAGAPGTPGSGKSYQGSGVPSTAVVPSPTDGDNYFDYTNNLMYIYKAVAPNVPASAIEIGGVYTILTVGSTNFLSLGASSNSVGTTFTAIASYPYGTVNPCKLVNNVNVADTSRVVNAMNIVSGKYYSIVSKQATDYSVVGSPANPAIGSIFVATANGSIAMIGTGTVSRSVGWRRVNPAITRGNIGNYMPDAAIGNAQIGSLAVGTLQIQENSVTVPSNAYTLAAIQLGTTATTLQTVTVTLATDSPVLVTGACFPQNATVSWTNYTITWQWLGSFSLTRTTNGVTTSLVAFNNTEFDVNLNYYDSPGVGVHTYKLTGQWVLKHPNLALTSITVASRSLTVLGVQR